VVSEQRARLTLDVDPELRRRLEIAAAAHDQTITTYVEWAIRSALAEEEHDAEWTRLSSAVFMRDWDSEEDAIYA